MQNQTGRDKTKWDKTGVILENKPHKQVLVKMDGSRRMTLRNRRFIKQIIPPVDTRPSQHRQQIPPSQGIPDTPAQPDPPLHQPHAQQNGDDPEQLTGDITEQLSRGVTENTFSPAGFSPAQTDQLETPLAPQPLVQTPPQSPAPTPSQTPPPSTDISSERPKRERKPNSLYDPAIYDLSKAGVETEGDNMGLEGQIEDSTTLSRGQVIELFKFILARLPEEKK